MLDFVSRAFGAHDALAKGRCTVGDSSPKSKNKQKQQDSTKKKHNAENAAAKQAPPSPTELGKKGRK